MSAGTKIEWTDYTRNYWSGCTKVSPACAHCYAESLSKINGKTFGKWGKGAERKYHGDGARKDLLRWNRDAGKTRLRPDGSVLKLVRANKSEVITRNSEGATGYVLRHAFESLPIWRPRVFINSMSDWLDDEVPIEWLAHLLETIHLCPNLDFQLLTKRPENFHGRLNAVYYSFDNAGTMAHGRWLHGWLTSQAVPENVWIGTTVENQEMADLRIPQLLSIPARVRFLSCEPLLGPVDIYKPVFFDPEETCSESQYKGWPEGSGVLRPGVDWVICGGESGAHARPMHPDWARSLRDQCQAAGVPFFFKQWGEWLPGCQYRDGDRERLREKAQHSFDADNHSWWVGKSEAGRLLDGRAWNEFPEVVR